VCAVGAVASLYVGGFYAYRDTAKGGWSDPDAQRMIWLAIELGVIAVGCLVGQSSSAGARNRDACLKPCAT
jgi:hypothetical protein